jgi:hypothetical protein
MKTTLMIVLCSAAMLASGCATCHTHSKAWDYKVVEGDSPGAVEAALSKLGSDGWIVVSSSSAMPQTSMSPEIVVILKRHK